MIIKPSLHSKGLIRCPCTYWQLCSFGQIWRDHFLGRVFPMDINIYMDGGCPSWTVIKIPSWGLGKLVPMEHWAVVERGKYCAMEKGSDMGKSGMLEFSWELPLTVSQKQNKTSLIGSMMSSDWETDAPWWTMSLDVIRRPASTLLSCTSHHVSPLTS